MTPMLHSERKAYAAMGRWRPAHRVIRALYFWIVGRLAVPSLPSRPFLFMWRQYRRMWPR